MSFRSQAIDSFDLPWMPLGAGVSIRPLRFAGHERSLQLKVEPGAVIPLHRHAGAVHAFNVSGSRILDDGTIVGPGGYVFEPAGNQDSWACWGEEPCVIQIAMSGRLTYIQPDGSAGEFTDTPSLRLQYLAWCRQNGFKPVAIGAEEVEKTQFGDVDLGFSRTTNE
jgi:2,4'-dihydroxyacetophenone dioxygenase